MEIEVSNYWDMVAAEHGHLPAEKVRRARVRAVVQPGTVHLALPEKLFRELGVPSAPKGMTAEL